MRLLLLGHEKVPAFNADGSEAEVNLRLYVEAHNGLVYALSRERAAELDPSRAGLREE